MNVKFPNEQVAIVIPAMNEVAVLPGIIEELKTIENTTIIVVDDASTDDTYHVVSQMGVVVLSHAVNLGAWRSMQTGMKYAIEHGFNRVITCDADGQHPKSSVLALLATDDSEMDCVIGSCISRGSRGRCLTWAFFRRLTGLNILDLTSGLRLYNKEALRVLTSHQATQFDFQDVAVLLMLRKYHLRVSEVEVQMNERLDGISRIFSSWAAVTRYIIYTFILSLSKLEWHQMPFINALSKGKQL